MKDTKTKMFNGKRYKLYSPKMFKSEANKVKKGLTAYFVRVVKTRESPSMHGQIYRTYIRKKK